MRTTSHAVVIGAGIGGLLSARVLSKHFDQVTVLEQDELPKGPYPRKSVPQGYHLHGLFASGAQVIEQLFPNFFEELVENGAVEADIAKDARWFHYGAWKLRTASGLITYMQSRPFLEFYLRERLLRDTRVRLIDNCKFTGLMSSKASSENADSTVTGVSYQVDGVSDCLDAELVVDAAGRGSRILRYVTALGYEPPEESRVEVNVGYASRLYEMPNDPDRDWKLMAVLSNPPGTKMGAISSIEGDRWMVTLMGFHKDYPPADEEGFLDFARRLDTLELHAAIKDARPLSNIQTYRFRAHLRRHFEHLERWPEGLLVIGNAVCSFSPVYGQGMSVCALQAAALEACLARDKESRGLHKRFFKDVAKVVQTPWLLATGADFMYPQTVGKRPLGTRALSWYNRKLIALSATDAEVYKLFMEIMHLIRPPRALFSPRVALKLLSSRSPARPAQTAFADVGGQHR